MPEDTLTRMAKGQDDAAPGEAAEVIAQLLVDFRERDTLYRLIDQTIFSEYELKIPDSYRATAQEIRSPLALNIANTVTAALSVNPPGVNFEPVGRGQGSLDNAKLREHFLEASWLRQETESGRQLFRAFMSSLVTKGEGVLKTVERKKRAWSGYAQYAKTLTRELEAGAQFKGLDRDSKERIYDAKTEEYKRGAPYPIVTTDVPPEQFYYWQGEDGLTVCAEVTEVPYLEALDRYGVALSSTGRVVPEAMGLPRSQWGQVMGKQRTLTRCEIWNWNKCVYTLSGPGNAGSQGVGRGTVVKVLTNHGYGDRYTRTLRGPYFHALGITTASRLPEKAGLSVLYGYLSLFPAMDQYLTIQGNSAFLTGFAAFKRLTPPGATLPAGPFGSDLADRDSTTTRLEPGTVYPYDIAPVDMPRGGVDLDKVIAQIRMMLESALPSVVQGVVSSDQSGYALNQAAQLARLAWNPIVANAEFALGARTGFESWLIEHKIKQKVYAFGSQPVTGSKSRQQRPTKEWLGLGPEELKGVHRYTVALNPETPSNRVLEIRSHKEMVDAGFETRAQAIEALGGDPGEVERGKLVEALKSDPEIIRRLRERVFQHLGMGEQAKLEQAEPGGTPGLGAPPGGAPGGSGGFAAGAPDAVAPGQGLPLQPPGPEGGLPSNPPGTPVQPGPPQGSMPLPGR